MPAKRILATRGEAVEKGDERKRSQIPVRTSWAVKERLVASATAADRSLTQEIEMRLERSIEMEGLQGGPQSSALLLRIAADLKAVEAFSGKSWDQDPATWYTAKLIINDAMNQYRPATESSEVLARAQASYERSTKALGLLLVLRSELKAAGGELEDGWQPKIDQILDDLTRDQESISAAVAELHAEEDHDQDLYQRFNRNRAMASALASWGNKGSGNGA